MTSTLPEQHVSIPEVDNQATPLGGVEGLRQTVDAKVAEFGDTRQGVMVDRTRNLQAALEGVEASVAQGDLATGQSVLEHAPRPQQLRGDVRDTLVDLHRAERGDPTSQQQYQAMSGLLLEVTRDISTLTDPKGSNLRYTEPKVQAHKAVEAAFKGRHRNYFDDTQPEGEIMQNGEQRTPHEVADDAYELLLSYTEDKLQEPGLQPEKAEWLRTARDVLHTEHKGWKEQFDAQNEVIGAVVEMVGEGDESLSGVKLKEAIRDCVGDDIPRLKELLEAARSTTDPYERFNILNSLQNQRSPVKDAKAFETWKRQRAEREQVGEEKRAAVLVDDARKTIEGIHEGGTPIVAEDDNKPSAEVVAADDIAPPLLEVPVVLAQPETKAVLPQAMQAEQPKVPETVKSPADPDSQFVKAALSRVPRAVLTESLAAIARDRLAGGKQVDIDALRQQLAERLSSGSLNVDPARLKALVGRIQQNGFQESNGGIWQTPANPDTTLGRIAADARSIVHEITAELLGE